LNQQQFEFGSYFGGLFSDSAIANDVVYANGTEWHTPAPPTKGDLVAFTSDAATELWRFSVPSTAFMSGVAVANGVVYFSALDGNLYALNAQSGALLAAVGINGSASGPSVSGGRVYVGTGDVFANLFGPNVPASILALGANNASYDDDGED
jgi:outer membrane protein assembly factor BamB